jgi:putative ABC transport system permease protein
MNIWFDLRYALRSLGKNPRFAMVSIFTLMLGIGACSAVFSVVYAVMLNPLPYRDSEQLCLLWKSVPKKGIERDWTSYLTFKDWKEQNQVFADMALYFRPEAAEVIMRNGDQIERKQASVVTANFFDVLGIAPILGRSFSTADSDARVDVAVLSYSYWQSRYGGSPDALGKSLQIDHRNAQIIGVMPAGSQFPLKDSPFWLLNTSDHRWTSPGFLSIRLADALGAIGRLKPGVTIAEAKAGMTQVANSLALQHPDTDAGLGISVVPLETALVGKNLRTALWLLLGAVALVMLIACANVASLMLARGFARQHEYAIRTALGAGRAALIKQLLVEAVALFVIAGALGAGLAAAIIRVLRALAPVNVPRLDEAGVSVEVLAFAFALSVLTAVTFGMAPAWKLLRNDPHEFLKQGARTDAAPGRRLMREILVSLECALLVILLAVTGLLMRSFLKLQEVDLGYRPDHLLSVDFRLPYEQYKDGDRTAVFYREAIERINALPGVSSASVGSVFQPDHPPNIKVVAEGASPTASGQESVSVGGDRVSDNYFQLMGIPLLQGRIFTEQDPLNVAVINQEMARRLWPGENPVGKRYGTGVPGETVTADTLVIGVVKNTLRSGRESDVIPWAYRSARHMAWRYDWRIVVRTATDPATLATPIRNVIRSMEKLIPEIEITTIEQALSDLDGQRRFQLQTLGAFSVIALLLAVVGIYSVLSNSVQQRTKEIGVRMALGAQPTDVVRSTLIQGMKPVLIGLGIGLIVALGAGRVMKSLLFHTPVADPWTFAGIAAILAAVAFWAAYLPARRASRVDPLIALRWE